MQVAAPDKPVDTYAPLLARAKAKYLALPAPVRILVPEDDAWAIDEECRYARWKLEAERRWRLSLVLRDPRQHEKRNAFKMACASDPVFFLKNVVWTRNPEDVNPGVPKELPLIPFAFHVRNWIGPWTKGMTIPKYKQADEKTRRLLYSICRMGWELWAFRFKPGRVAWVSSAKDTAIDNGEDWNSLMGKFRFMWRKAREFYPWLFPELPMSSELNKQGYIRFPEWKEANTEIDRPCWGNELWGFLPSDISGRGGAASSGWIDEAHWIADLSRFLDSISYMTPSLTAGSTAKADAEHSYYKAVKGIVPGWKVTTSWWGMDPTWLMGMEWRDGEESFQSPVAKWRGTRFDQEAKGMTRESVAQNLGLDYTMAGAGKVFVNYNPAIALGSTNPKDPTYDLYDPELPLTVWYDVGYADPHAFLWMQYSDATGELNLVDFHMQDGVTSHWFVPLILGWNERTMGSWKTAPERLPWGGEQGAVPWPYSESARQVLRYWHTRRKPEHLVGDIYGKGRMGDSKFTVEDRFRAYGIKVYSSSPAHHMDDWIAHANEVLPRMRISGRLIGRRPEGRFPPIDEVFLAWQRMASTEGGRPDKPIHNIHSHAGSAFIFGAKTLPAQVYGRVDRVTGRFIEPPKKFTKVTLAPADDAMVGWL